MDRFLVFVYPLFYPGGGWEDFAGSAATLPEAQALLQVRVRERVQAGAVGHLRGHIVDTEGPTIVQYDR
jgi:hypothetical protein